ncbi:Bro-N domain-containing protein [Pseudomonas sp. GL-B-19]|uniref:BRO-N domain-containing protein n=1 Tax=Pseudomonas sp. GL-B-19 TaxID=2832393 RepID=UPI001CBAB7F9|nr:Bro-N domain-containing protein [Pseudomonas sp. GL-B-19]
MSAHAQNSLLPYFTPTVFTRHSRFFHAFMQDNQAWFCVQDLGRLMGRTMDQRLTLKLDPDQRRYVFLLKNGKTVESLMVSESGVYTLLIYHFVPENRNLRQWLSNEVIPTLRESKAAVDNIPSLSSLQWAGISVPLLHWQHQAWIKWRDMPDLMQVQRPFKIMGTCS